MLNKEEIKNIIPQRDPFLMIDEVEEYVPGESAIAYKNVNEVNLCIQIINGNPMYWGGSWSSTIYDFDTAWSFHWGKGEMGRNLRKDNVNVCPFAPL